MDVAARSILAALCVNLPPVALDLKSLCEGILILQFCSETPAAAPHKRSGCPVVGGTGGEQGRAAHVTRTGPASPALSSPLTESSCSDFVTLHPLRSLLFPSDPHCDRGLLAPRVASAHL